MKRNLLFILVIVLLGALGYLGYIAVNLIFPQPEVKIITTPTVVTLTGPVILSAINNEANLETYSMVIVNDQDITKVWGVEGVCQESLTYLGYYTVTAGIDLRDIPESAIVLDGNGEPSQTTVTINLPPASILHVELDTKRSRTVHSSPSILSQVCGTRLPEMVTEAQTAIRATVEEAARQQNIIQLAQDRASFELKKILLQLGFTHVTIKYNGSVNDR